MKTRDFLRLPFNREFKITDGIYDYTLIKKMSSGDVELDIKPSVIYILKEIRKMYDVLYLYNTEKTDVDGITYTEITASINYAGINFYQDLGYYNKSKLKIGQ